MDQIKKIKLHDFCICFAHCNLRALALRKFNFNIVFPSNSRKKICSEFEEKKGNNVNFSISESSNLQKKWALNCKNCLISCIEKRNNK